MTLQPATHTEAPYLFSARELARLAIYRAAVAAHFYTDQLDQPTGDRESETLRLLETLRSERRAA